MRPDTGPRSAWFPRLEVVVDDWYAEYLKEPQHPNPYEQARRLQEAWRHAQRVVKDGDALRPAQRGEDD